jgi:4-hydroxy-3-polyprenylbenzoate decarboxylase
MASAVVKRLTVRKVAEIKDENTARAAIRQVVLDNLNAEEQLDADARKLLMDHAKQIKDSAADYRQLLGKVKEKLARERGSSSDDAHEPRAPVPPDRSDLEELRTTQGVSIKAPDELRTEVLRAHRRACRVDRRRGPEDLERLPRPMPEGSHEGSALREDPQCSARVPPLKTRRQDHGRDRIDLWDSSARDPRGRPTQTHLVISAPGKRTIVEETAFTVRDVEALAAHHYDIRDIGASIASGSFKTAGMVIAPCSIKTAGAIASCHTDSLIARAADVTLKEGRPLIVLLRETPLHIGHLKCMVALAEMGAVLLPPMPAQQPTQGPRRHRDHTVARVLDRLNLPRSSLSGRARPGVSAGAG